MYKLIFTTDTTINGQDFWRGEVVELHNNEVIRIAKGRKAGDYPVGDKKELDKLIADSLIFDQEQDHLVLLSSLTFGHLPPNLQETSKPFCDAGWDLFNKHPNPNYFLVDTLAHLRKAKDSAVTYSLTAS